MPNQGTYWNWPEDKERLFALAKEPDTRNWTHLAEKFGRARTTIVSAAGTNGWTEDLEALLYNTEAPEDPLSNTLYAILRKTTKRQGTTVSDLADELDVSPRRIREALSDLADSGTHIHRSGDIVSAYILTGLESHTSVDVEPKERMWLGVVSDTHLGSCLQQPTLCKAFMERSADRFDLSGWVHVGDASDGQGVYRGHEHETWIQGVDDQADYFAEVYPDTGVPTWMIAGNHDYIHIAKAGADVVARIAGKRDDVIPIGYRGGYLDIGALSTYLWHPTGGASYAKSYKLQRRVEGFSDTNKPHVLLTGHLHQFAWIWHRNVHAFLVPSWQATSVFIRSLGHESMVGGLVLEVAFDDLGAPVEVTPHLSKYDPLEKDYPRWR